MSDAASDLPEGFAADFDKLLPYIAKEWPELEKTALEQTAGDYDKVVTLIATTTEHTRTLVRKQLAELRKMFAARSEQPSWSSDAELRRLRELLERLQFKSTDVSEYVRGRMAEDARQQVKESPLMTLLMAVGLGFILGFIMRGGGGRR